MIESKYVTDQALNSEAPKSITLKWYWKIIEALPTLVLFLGFLAYCFCVNFIEMTGARNKPLKFTKYYA